MTWTEKDRERLLIFKDRPDNDDIKVKEKIKQVLLDDKYILHALDNKELEPLVEDDGTNADAYYGINILPYYLVSPTQSSASAFICFETSFEKRRYDANKERKNLNIIFYFLVFQCFQLM